MTLGMRQTLEMAAIFMIGDGLLGVLQAERHVALWRSGIAAPGMLVRPFDGRPRRRRVYGLLQVAAGLALASTLTSPRSPVQRIVR